LKKLNKEFPDIEFDNVDLDWDIDMKFLDS